MNYAMSDIHGRYDKYLKMTDLIGFKEDDSLYILGDVIDRGADRIKILLDIMERERMLL